MHFTHALQVYCQCLCLLAKLFLDHKTLYYDVSTRGRYAAMNAATSPMGGRLMICISTFRPLPSPALSR